MFIKETKTNHICSAQKRIEAKYITTYQALGACFNPYKDRFKLNRDDVGDENKPGGGFI